MNYDINLALMTGADIPIPECQLVIHQPRLSEIALIGDEDFFTAIQTLCVNKNMIAQGETLLADTNNFQIFMTIMQEKQTSDKKEAVKSLFTLLFPTYQCAITPQSILLIKENTVIIDQTNFDAFQTVIKEIFCINSSSGPMETQVFNPQGEKAKEIADKLMRARQRVAAQQPGQQGSVLAQYISVLTVGIGSMSLQDCCALTMYQLFDLIERYSLYLNWDLDVRSRLAGTKGDKPLDNWMKKIH